MMEDQTPFEKSPFYKSYKNQSYTRDKIMELCLEHSMGGVLIFGFDGKILYSNKNLRMMLGFNSNDNLNGLKFQQIINTEKSLSDIFLNLQENGYWIGEIEVVDKDGIVNIFHLISNLVYDNDFNPVCIYASFTERMDIHAYKEISVQAEELENQNDSLVSACKELHEKNMKLQLEMFDIVENKLIEEGVDEFDDLDNPKIQDFSRKTTIASLNQQLTHSKSQIKILGGFLPICSNCKKIRDDMGYWTQIEEFFRDNSEIEFSHSLCPICAKLLYGDLD